jgi:hypothetical protein
MEFLNKLFFAMFPLFGIFIGLFCIFYSKHSYKINLRVVEHSARKYKRIPILNKLARDRANQTREGGTIFIKVWGFGVLLVGIAWLISIFG